MARPGLAEGQKKALPAEQRRADAARHLDVVIHALVEGHNRPCIDLPNIARSQIEPHKVTAAAVNTMPGPASLSRMKPSPPKKHFFGKQWHYYLSES